ncbi:MAG: ATP-binding protein, partial [Campylobacteraceae bacterium]|nr:ATP-binding protein [Campylobacteraceae bacterium]
MGLVLLESLVRFNQQLLVTYECVNAVGISLNLEEMLNHFLRIFVRKSEALAGGFWVEKNSKYILACGQGKKDIFASIEPIGVEESWEIVEKNEKEKILFVRIGGGIMSFMFILNDEEIELVESILRSLYTKLDNAINACLNHERLLMLNTKLQEQVNEEVEKNRQKDKHILQQSRLAQMGEMISMIAHQWRQPLGSISAVTASVKVKILLKKFDLTEEKGQEEIVRYLLESVDKIEHYVKFLSTTIDDFRNFFKPEKRKETVTLKDLIDRAFLVAGKALEVNGIALHRDEKSKRELTLYSNETMQVILNLIKNAEDALKERDISK